ncbi:unnamed protein product [Trifolium pratense]|uniref:Uncharacterized protein n=2 Tax=Trifolium pratense TaxID=57577 RepID=A0ACB0LGA8_TRIPR|nr:unnamed protein product [Trifolium pratense]
MLIGSDCHGFQMHSYHIFADAFGGKRHFKIGSSISIITTFLGKNGRAFLFSHAMNVVTGPKEDRTLLTGLHTVADVYCGDCREVLGWKYERAYEPSQKYKEGKFILEKSKIVKENW